MMRDSLVVGGEMVNLIPDMIISEYFTFAFDVKMNNLLSLNEEQKIHFVQSVINSKSESSKKKFLLISLEEQMIEEKFQIRHQLEQMGVLVSN